MPKLKPQEEMPPLQHLEVHEVKIIKKMFNYYDYDKTGRIKRHLAFKLLQKLGLLIPIESLPPFLAFKDIVLFADSRCPDPTLEGALDICFRLSSTKVKDNGEEKDLLFAQGVINFLKDLDRRPPTISEASTLLVSMLPYDDCAAEPAVSRDAFTEKMVSLAVKLPTGNNSTP
mmetsp:Transcript_3972/g.4055  ORF Transcript_3972/g.4055 Transcript_3972/m.4055 type:complete len:173 (+) Transcript_3972:259-777(+)|eukprot:CAMPEP_0182418746 /NCGR_PEP_ID=MMETSP1167-20130531/3123_1 /TAXON_ID=2988 /ORGANISM="Mallomonas Sp, Strain CCMP3275" /LENGTH=172 /DNA_ID=CAMNT_0024593105 /DNA_START=217 /DNA_END=735 /DNA_ORIENTATION=-